MSELFGLCCWLWKRGGKGGIAFFDVNPLISTFWGDSCIFTFIIIVTILLQV